MTGGSSNTTGGSTSGSTNGSTGGGLDRGDSIGGSDDVGSIGASTGAGQESGTTESPGGPLWCLDEDSDGHGDPDDCEISDEPIDGRVDNSDDCDDTDPHTFPGAAENDDPRACMRDADEDGYGDDDPPKGVEPGTDCDDTDNNAFPGSAENETPPNACMVDGDGDGWGDANPGDGPASGSDCFDANMDLNPDMLVLTAFLPYQQGPAVPRTLATVNPLDAAIAPFLNVLDPMGSNPNVNLAAAAMNGNGEIYASDSTLAQLHSLDYTATCMDDIAELTPLGPPYGMPGNVVCGIEFGGNGMLYGIDYANNLLTFDTTTGDTIDPPTPITLMGAGALDIQSCGMAFDCTEDRLLVANGIDQTIYSVDPSNGEAIVVRDLGGFPALAFTWLPAGLEYDPVSRNAYLSTGNVLWEVDLDSPNAPPLINVFAQPVSNLQYLPICM